MVHSLTTDMLIKGGMVIVDIDGHVGWDSRVDGTRSIQGLVRAVGCHFHHTAAA